MSDKLKTILIIILVIVVGVLGVCGFGYIRQKMVANEGIKLLNDKEYQSAYEKFQDAERKFTLFWTAQKSDTIMYQGEALYRMEKYSEALKVYEKLMDRDDYRAYSFAALCYMGMKDNKKAMAVCDEGIDKLPNAGDIYCTKYGIYASQKKYEEGLIVIESALKQPDLESRESVMLTQISAYESMKEYDKALEYAKVFVKAYPNNQQGKKELEFLQTR